MWVIVVAGRPHGVPPVSDVLEKIAPWGDDPPGPAA